MLDFLPNESHHHVGRTVSLPATKKVIDYYFIWKFVRVFWLIFLFYFCKKGEKSITGEVFRLTSSNKRLQWRQTGKRLINEMGSRKWKLYLALARRDPPTWSRPSSHYRSTYAYRGMRIIVPDLVTKNSDSIGPRVPSLVSSFVRSFIHSLVH